ncbi:hypothetical protein CBE75_05655 [Bacillus subtilis]|nr:hypothetical protein CBE75_05655 [Bacillus subtilis]
MILFNDIRAIQPYIWFVFRVLFFRYVWRYDNCIVYGSNCLLYGFVVYGLFAVPLQMKLQKKARTFNVMYLLIYSVVAFIAAFLFFVINEPASIAWTLQSYFYYMLSIAAAVIYWLWDSLILYKRTASGV